MVRYCESVNFKVVILTDISSKPSIDEMLPSIIQGHIDNKFSSWIEEVQKSDYYKHVISKTDFITELSKIKDDNHVFLYYTGHGSKNNLVMPNGDMVSVTSLKDYITTTTHDIVYLLDCCDINSIETWNYVLTKKNNFVYNENIPKVYQRVYCISHQNNIPLTSANGSRFSREIINAWTQKKRLWSDIAESKVLSTRPLGNKVPSWLLNEGNIEVTPWFILVK